MGLDRIYTPKVCTSTILIANSYGTSPTSRPSRTLLHAPAPGTSPPLALHEVPAGMTGPTDRLLGQPRHRGVERHERIHRFFGIAVPD